MLNDPLRYFSIWAGSGWTLILISVYCLLRSDHAPIHVRGRIVGVAGALGALLCVDRALVILLFPSLTYYVDAWTTWWLWFCVTANTGLIGLLIGAWWWRKLNTPEDPRAFLRPDHNHPKHFRVGHSALVALAQPSKRRHHLN